MGTKNDSGPYDCYAKAADDEPLFTLLARDWRAPYLVDAWASMYVGDFAGAHAAISDARREFLSSAEKKGKAEFYNHEKSTEAVQCSALMREYFAKIKNEDHG